MSDATRLALSLAPAIILSILLARRPTRRDVQAAREIGYRLGRA